MISARRSLMTLEIPQDTPDGFGGLVRSYVAGPSLWARIVPLKYNYDRTAEQTELHVTHRVIIRHRTDIDLSRRLRLGARLFALRGYFDPDGRRINLVLWCKEIRS